MPLVIEQQVLCVLANRRRADDYEPQATTLAFLQPSGGRRHVASCRAAPRRRRWGGITCRKRDALRPTREATRVTLRRASVQVGDLAVSGFDYCFESSVSDLPEFSSRFHEDFHAFNRSLWVILYFCRSYGRDAYANNLWIFINGISLRKIIRHFTPRIVQLKMLLKMWIKETLFFLE